MEARYYISSGKLNCFYTLRYQSEDWIYIKGDRGVVLEKQRVLRDYHVCNLATDRNEAILKAKQRVGIQLSADFDVQEIRRRAAGEVDWSIFQAGKYAGQSIHEVADLDMDYLLFISSAMQNSAKYAKTAEMIEALPEIIERRCLQAESMALLLARKQEIAMALMPLAGQLADGKGGFCDSVAEAMRGGDVPSERCRFVTMDILAKKCGRRGSAAYNLKHREVESIFTAALELSQSQLSVSDVAACQPDGPGL